MVGGSEGICKQIAADFASRGAFLIPSMSVSNIKAFHRGRGESCDYGKD